MTTKILRLSSVIELTGLSRSSIYSQIAQGSFPRRVSIGLRAFGWREVDIQTWLDHLPPNH
jgi:prophage regulatory protein